ncbi:MAG: hypothetical protein ACKOET_17480, partial [Verrucomicrobiota bacterium]
MIPSFPAWLGFGALLVFGGVLRAAPGITETNLPYRTGELTDAMRERCRVDVHRPAGRGDFPTVVWFHGGGLTEGHRSLPPALLDREVAVVA